MFCSVVDPDPHGPASFWEPISLKNQDLDPHQSCTDSKSLLFYFMLLKLSWIPPVLPNDDHYKTQQKITSTSQGRNCRKLTETIMVLN